MDVLLLRCLLEPGKFQPESTNADEDLAVMENGRPSFSGTVDERGAVVTAMWSDYSRSQRISSGRDGAIVYGLGSLRSWYVANRGSANAFSLRSAAGCQCSCSSVERV